MLPHNAKIVIRNHKAIVFNDDEKCLELWLNNERPDFHPIWTCVGRAYNQQELDKFVTKEDLHDVLDEAVMWFWCLKRQSGRLLGLKSLSVKPLFRVIPLAV